MLAGFQLYHEALLGRGTRHNLPTLAKALECKVGNITDGGAPHEHALLQQPLSLTITSGFISSGSPRVLRRIITNLHQYGYPAHWSVCRLSVPTSADIPFAVIFKLKPGVTDAQLAELRTVGEAMVGQIPGEPRHRAGAAAK